MKKISRFVALSLMMSICFCMIGCGEKDKFFGKWTYNYDTEKVIIDFKTGGKVDYKGTAYTYVDKDGVLEFSSKDETFERKYKFDGDVMYVYEPMTYHYQGEGDADGLIGYWLADNGRSNYEFTTEGTFREDSYIPGRYFVNEEEGTILCIYNDQYYDTIIYYVLDGNTLTVEYPWAMLKKQ